MESSPIFPQPKVDAFLDRIKISPQIREYLKTSGGGKHGLEAMTALQQATMTTIPFENSSLHYGPYPDFHLEHNQLYHKIVERNEGGACFQVTRLFMHMMRSLGFQCYPTCARINLNVSANAAPGASGSVFGEWSHMLLIATIDGERYVVDPCFGPNMPTSPVPVRENDVHVDVAGRERRLAYSNIGQNTDKDQRYWIMQFRAAARNNRPSGKWTDAYCFRMEEFLMSDFETVHMSCRYGRKAWFMHKLMAFRWISDASGQPSGWYMMWENALRRNWQGKVSLIQTFNVEEERAAALAMYFGVSKTTADVDHSVGSVASIKPSPPPKPSAPAQEKAWLHQRMPEAKL